MDEARQHPLGELGGEHAESSRQLHKLRGQFDRSGAFILHSFSSVVAMGIPWRVMNKKISGGVAPRRNLGRMARKLKSEKSA